MTHSTLDHLPTHPRRRWMILRFPKELRLGHFRRSEPLRRRS
jgi:hypothetical protein